MQSLDIQGRRVGYTTAGDGFPLLLAPGVPGGWTPVLPLLEELCRAIAYTPLEPAVPPLQAAEVEALCQGLELERVYMASPAVHWHTTLAFARSAPQRLEGLILLATEPLAEATVTALYEGAPVWPSLTVPTLLLTIDTVHAASPVIDWLQTRLPRCATQRLAGPESLSLPLGHAMIRFLLHCERQRNLVRGASFLL